MQDSFKSQFFRVRSFRLEKDIQGLKGRERFEGEIFKFFYITHNLGINSSTKCFVQCTIL